MAQELIEIDGNFGEGGGAIIRTALALSALTGKGFTAHDIRKGREKPGLKSQHLHCIRALQELCSAKATDAYLGSGEITFVPGLLRGKDITIDIETAGSVTLLLQSLLLPAAFSQKKVKMTLIGGTEVRWAMPCDYLKEVVLPQLQCYASFGMKICSRGYFPRGGGKVELAVAPRYPLTEGKMGIESIMTLRKLNLRKELLEQQRLLHIRGVSHASSHLAKGRVAERQADSARKTLKEVFSCPVVIEETYAYAASPGSGITLWAVFSKDEDYIHPLNPTRLGSDALGEKGRMAEVVGKEAALSLIGEIDSGAPVDSHLADNLLPWIAIFGGSFSTSEITGHTRSNAYVIEKFLGAVLAINEGAKRITSAF
ncbi:TPA: RNA 3'-terminal phosphate cyclase [Candidatus Woesearchaeota archaeon]|nr:RNA 3'-terminal phosphate cyclase [Candidatus Woesearchaeota archaeon]HII69303.1 RNA 3'-terminal phosphate cyclase [Candidatus Woesearchaeota archaeon]